jgi:hypothetical protein
MPCCPCAQPHAQVLPVHRLLQPAAAGAAARLGCCCRPGWAHSRRSTVFVVSDFISAPGWEKPLAQLAQRHDVVAVRLFDPLELELPDLGLVLLRDAETGEQLLVDTHDKAFASALPAIAAAARGRPAHRLAAAGADTLELPPMTT